MNKHLIYFFSAVLAIVAHPVYSNCMFCKGGMLSIDKPFDKGGGLSIDKPFDKGGSLSIDKIFVPKQLQIGKPKTLIEVIFPYCWGSPQDCRGTKDEKSSPTGSTPWPQDYPYYVILRLSCSDRATGELSGKECDLNVGSNESCAKAQEYGLQRIREVDLCQYCDGTNDSGQFWDSARYPPEYVQGGACQSVGSAGDFIK